MIKEMVLAALVALSLTACGGEPDGMPPVSTTDGAPSVPTSDGAPTPEAASPTVDAGSPAVDAAPAKNFCCIAAGPASCWGAASLSCESAAQGVWGCDLTDAGTE